jgi:Poxvirus Late Transcription Factor VLTF3 like
VYLRACSDEVDVIENMRRTMRHAQVRASVRAKLQTLGYNKYYEKCGHIAHVITGVPPPSMSAANIECLKEMFKRVETSYEHHRPPHRKNFISYMYVLYKLVEIMMMAARDPDERDGLAEVLESIALLKSTKLLHNHDEIWEKVCAELGWKFVSSSNVHNS